MEQLPIVVVFGGYTLIIFAMGVIGGIMLMM